MVSSVMHFYSIPFAEVIELPISLFWELCKNIDRIRAEKDRRLFSAIAASRGHNPGDYLNKLDQEQGTVIETETLPIFDMQGFARLKNLVSRRK